MQVTDTQTKQTSAERPIEGCIASYNYNVRVLWVHRNRVVQISLARTQRQEVKRTPMEEHLSQREETHVAFGGERNLFPCICIDIVAPNIPA